MIALIRVGTVNMLRNGFNLGIPWREGPQGFLIIGFEMWESSLPTVTQGSFLKFHFYFILEYNWLTVSCFRCPAKWFSYIYTHTHIHIRSFSDSFLILVITECWVEFPVLCSGSLLIIYMHVYVNPTIPNLYPPATIFSFGNHRFDTSLILKLVSLFLLCR